LANPARAAEPGPAPASESAVAILLIYFAICGGRCQQFTRRLAAAPPGPAQISSTPSRAQGNHHDAGRLRHT